jgi:hypothetical protein
VKGKKVEARYVHEVQKVMMETTSFESYEKTCPCCGTVSHGDFPEPMRGMQQYGPNLKAYIVMFTAYGTMSMGRLPALMRGIFAQEITEGTIAGIVKEYGSRLRGPVGAIRVEEPWDIVVITHGVNEVFDVYDDTPDEGYGGDGLGGDTQRIPRGSGA